MNNLTISNRTDLAVIPNRLYHYTSLESLALILENKSIRFMRLTEMDDKQEVLTVDAKGIGKYFYASCWTDSDAESIPMWNMYTPIDSGVRISLPTDPFPRYELGPNELHSLMPGAKVELEDNWKPLKTLIPIKELSQSWCLTNPDECLARKIDYSDDYSMLVPSLCTEDNDHINIKFDGFGTVKNTGWSFQKEWRYILQLMLSPLTISPEESAKLAQVMGKDILEGNLVETRKYIDLPIDDSALCSLEITPSPKMSLGNRLLFNCLIDKYCPTAVIRESMFAGLL